MPSTSPHDALFKAAFSDVDEVTPLLRAVLPTQLAEAIDWGSLKLEPGTFVDDALKARVTDLLFVCRVGRRRAFLYLLVEHQSRSDRWMAFRVLRYVVKIWEQFRADHPRASRLPPVIAVVLHHGAKPWSAATDIAELVDADPALRGALAPHTPRLRFVLDDLTEATDAMIRARALRAFGEVTLRALRDLRGSANPIEDVRRWVPLLRRMLTAPTGLQRLRAILEYLWSVADVDVGEVTAVVQSLGAGAEEMQMPTTAERWKAEGRVQAQQRTLLRQLTLRFGTVSEAARAHIERADEPTLDRYIDRVITAPTLEAVFADA